MPKSHHLKTVTTLTAIGIAVGVSILSRPSGLDSPLPVAKASKDNPPESPSEEDIFDRIASLGVAYSKLGEVRIVNAFVDCINLGGTTMDFRTTYSFRLADGSRIGGVGSYLVGSPVTKVDDEYTVAIKKTLKRGDSFDLWRPSTVGVTEADPWYLETEILGTAPGHNKSLNPTSDPHEPG